MDREPLLLAVEKTGKNAFDHDSGVLFQFLPSGKCLHSTVSTPLIMGRGTSDSIDGDMFDLSSFNAMRHGVSRRHCQIQRHDSCLTVSDLGSTNGTYLNGRLLQPYEQAALANGDELVFGTLHVVIFFERNMNV